MFNRSLTFLLCLYASFAYDNQITLSSTQASAMCIHHSTSTVVLANKNLEIEHRKIITTASINTHSTTHKAAISSITVSSDASLVLTGSRDYTAELRYLANGSLICKWDQLRGKITGTTILSDMIRVAFVSQEGYLYYSYSSNCTLHTVSFDNHRFTSITSLSSGDQVWVTDYSTNLIVYDISADTNTTYTIGSDKLVTVTTIENTNYIGVCSRKAFMILDTSASVLYTLSHPAGQSKVCRIMPSSATQLYLTATTELQTIEINGNNYELLWNIWKITIGAGPTFTKELVREQDNDGNRYGNDNSQVTDAGLFFIDTKQVWVVSIAQGFNPIQNVFGDNSSNGCDSGTYDKSDCEFCIQVVQACSDCRNSDGRCNTCYNYHYLVYSGSLRSCDPCPTQCYSCSSSTNCKGCQPGYVLSGNDCIACNLTQCVNCEIKSGQTRCWECAIGYYTVLWKDCMECQAKYPGCLECNATVCSVCDAGYVLINATTGICEQCSHYFEGCAACISSTYCETCYETHPYFDTISSTNRTCQQSCIYTCLTCEHFYYDRCDSCDENRTLSGTTCSCKNTGFIQDTVTLQCLACVQYISNCLNCTSETYCSTCDSGYEYETINGTHRGCKVCNYSCATCSVEWDVCASCNAADFRVLSGTQCVCMDITYFQYGSNTACEECPDHIDDCITCLNETFCLTCDNGLYLNTISAGNNQCALCSSPCTQCFGSATNCTQCASGRQLDHTTNTCVCLAGYYESGTVSCGLCSDVLGSCESCTNATVCLSCWENNYFEISGSQTICAQCQQTCLTCNTWTNVCATCDPSARRTLNATTFQCDCQSGYIQTLGECLNCAQTFTNCTSCNSTHCFSCDTGFSLAFGGLKCVECSASYHGCTLCLNGVCAECNATLNFQLSYSMCICKAGFYWKNLECTAYKIGSKVKRSFPVTAFYEQSFETQAVVIKLYFECTGLKFPYGVTDSVKLTINGNEVNYNYTHDDQILTLEYTPTSEQSKASIEVQLVEDRVFDEDQYQASTRTFSFSKNIYYNSEKYTLAVNFAQSYETIILAIRWIFTILLLLGCADLVMTLIFISHTLPAFLFLDLSIPTPLRVMLSAMMKIHQQSLFVFGDLNLSFEPYDTSVYETHGIEKSFLQSRVIDCITLAAIIVFYGIIGNLMTKIIPSGKISKVWHYKFVEKRYSTLALSILCFAPAFLLSSLLNFEMQSQNTNQIINVGISVIICTFLCIFVFVHSLYVYSTQMEDDYKNQDCYMGASQIQEKSPIFIVSLLIVYVWTIPLIFIMPGIGSLPLVMCLMMWNIIFFKNWSFFPNKALFFIKLFISVMFLLQVAGFLVFEISQNYAPVAISTLELIGLSLTVNVIILLSLSGTQLLFLFVLGFIRFCRINSNTVQEETNFEDQSDGSENYERTNPNKSGPSSKRDFSNNLRNKKDHLKKFVDDRLIIENRSGLPDKMKSSAKKNLFLP